MSGSGSRREPGSCCKEYMLGSVSVSQTRCMRQHVSSLGCRPTVELNGQSENCAG